MTTSQPTPDVCPYCGNPYPVFILPALFGAKQRTIRARCSCDGAMAEEARVARAERQKLLRSAWERTGVPKAYLDVEADKAGLALLDLAEGNGLYLHGERGTGKTQAACALLKAYVARNTSDAGWCSARFFSAPRWLDSIQEAYGKWGASAEDAFYRAAGVDFLVFDDIGKLNSNATAWAVGKLFELVDERYCEKRPTVFTSKFDIPSLAMALSVNGSVDVSGDIVSRIRQRCEPVLFEGPDRRLPHA